MASKIMASKRLAAAAAPRLRSCFSSRGFATAAAHQVAPQEPRRSRREVTPFLPLGIFDLWEPVSSNRSMRQMLDTIDRFVDAPASTLSSRSGVRTPWDILEKQDAFYLRVDMPGVDKSELSISVEDEELVIKGEHKVGAGQEEDVFGDSSRSYNTRMILPKEVDKANIKAELKNGVLSIIVPKAKPEEKKVTQVQVS